MKTLVTFDKGNVVEAMRKWLLAERRFTMENKNKNNEDKNIVDAAIKIGSCGIGYSWVAMMLAAEEIVPNKETEREESK